MWSQVSMDLVLRYRFVPLREEGFALAVAVPRPDNYRELDDLELALGRPLVLEVAPAEQIDSVIERNATSSFLLEEASERLKLDLVGEDEPTMEVGGPEGEGSSSPVIKLIDSGNSSSTVAAPQS